MVIRIKDKSLRYAVFSLLVSAAIYFTLLSGMMAYSIVQTIRAKPEPQEKPMRVPNSQLVEEVVISR